ncbi:MAG: sugar ABC transporter substrate-binding protein [Lachnospiraceae bacterium]|nr:sugar ABC transporter substrate-binding protein [Lachnospiraceae bacterium]
MKQHAFFICSACLATVLLFLILCQPDFSSDNQQKNYRVIAILNPEGDMFWKTVWQGVQSSAEDAPFALSEYEYTFSNTTEASELLDIAIRTNADGILLHPKDTLDSEFYNHLASAKQQGMKIVLLDGTILTHDYDAFVGIDNRNAGASAAQYIISNHEPRQEILLLLNENGLSNALKKRVNGFFSAIGEKSISTNVYTIETSSNVSQGIPDIQDFLLENDKITYLVAFSSTTTLKAAGAISMSDLAERVQVIGFGDNAEALQYVKSGIIKALFVQNSYQMGEKSVEIMEQLLLDEEPVPLENEIDIFLVTPDNIDEYMEKRGNGAP